MKTQSNNTKSLTASPLLDDKAPENKLLTAFLLGLVAIMLTLLILISVVGTCVVSGNSMDPTLYGGNASAEIEGDRVLVNKFARIAPGDIIALKAPAAAVGYKGKLFIKRVVAVGGDTVRFTLIDVPPSNSTTPPFFQPDTKTGVAVFVKSKNSTDFKPFLDYNLYEPMTYGTYCSKLEFDKNGVYEFTVPSDHFYYMGDNRNHSSDSRSYGSSPLKDVYGKMFHKLKPGTFTDWFFRILYRTPTQ